MLGVLDILETTPHLETEITFVPTAEGGRSTPAFSGFRPQFFYAGRDWDAEHEYVGVDRVNPGDTVIALLRFPNPHNHVGKFTDGMEFLIRDGPRTIGRGKILRVSDPSLRMDA